MPSASFQAVSAGRISVAICGGELLAAAIAAAPSFAMDFASGEVRTQAPEDYTSHNTRRLTVDEVVDKLLSLEYVKEELAALGK